MFRKKKKKKKPLLLLDGGNRKVVSEAGFTVLHDKRANYSLAVPLSFPMLMSFSRFSIMYRNVTHISPCFSLILNKFEFYIIRMAFGDSLGTTQ